MTTLQADIPDSLMKQVAAQVSAWKNTESISARARRADYAAFDRVMAKVPAVPPTPRDELAEDYPRTES